MFLLIFYIHHHPLLLPFLMDDFANIQDIFHFLDMFLLHIIEKFHIYALEVSFHHNKPHHMVLFKVEVDEVVKEAMMAKEVDMLVFYIWVEENDTFQVNFAYFLMKFSFS